MKFNTYTKLFLLYVSIFICTVFNSFAKINSTPKTAYILFKPGTYLLDTINKQPIRNTFLPYGCKVTIIKKNAKWHKDGMITYRYFTIKYKGHIGYCPDAYLFKYPCPKTVSDTDTLSIQSYLSTALTKNQFSYHEFIDTVNFKSGQIITIKQTDIFSSYFLLKSIWDSKETPFPAKLNKPKYKFENCTLDVSVSKEKDGCRPNSLFLSWRYDGGETTVSIKKKKGYVEINITYLPD